MRLLKIVYSISTFTLYTNDIVRNFRLFTLCVIINIEEYFKPNLRYKFPKLKT